MASTRKKHGKPNHTSTRFTGERLKKNLYYLSNNNLKKKHLKKMDPQTEKIAGTNDTKDADGVDANAAFYSLFQQMLDGMREINFSNFLTLMIFLYNTLFTEASTDLVSFIKNGTDPRHVDYKFDTSGNINITNAIWKILNGACSNPDNTYVPDGTEIPVQWDIVKEMKDMYEHTIAIIISKGQDQLSNLDFINCVENLLEEILHAYEEAEKRRDRLDNLFLGIALICLLVTLVVVILCTRYLIKKSCQACTEGKEAPVNEQSSLLPTAVDTTFPLEQPKKSCFDKMTSLFKLKKTEANEINIALSEITQKL